MARVLVVEDEESIRVPLATALRSAGHQVQECADGTGFEELVDAFRPNVALLDLNLPGGTATPWPARCAIAATVRC